MMKNIFTTVIGWLKVTFQTWIRMSISTTIFRVEAVTAVLLLWGFFNAVVTIRDVGLGSYAVFTKDNLANAIEQIPDGRRNLLADLYSKGKITGYRRVLEIQLLQEIRQETSALATKIRRLSEEQWGRMWAEQSIQFVTGQVAGLETAGALSRGMDLKALKDLMLLGENLAQSYYSVTSIDSALKGTQIKLEPDLNAKQDLLALKIEHILNVGLKERQHELMADYFRLVILGLKRSYCRDSEEEYRSYLQSQAQYYSAKLLMTKNTGSYDSIWKDWKDFGSWLHKHVLAGIDKNCRKAEAVPQENKFTATCIFTSKDKEKTGLEIGRRNIHASSQSGLEEQIRQHCTTNDYHVSVQSQGSNKSTQHAATCIFMSKTKKNTEIGRREVNASSNQDLDSKIQQHCTTDDFNVIVKYD